MKTTVRGLTAEFIGTFVLVCSVIGMQVQFAGSRSPIAGILGAVVPSFVLAGMIIWLGPVSGGHFNPAVSMGAAVTGSTGWLKAIGYIVVQLAAGICAGYAVAWLYPDEQVVESQLGMPHPKIDPFAAGILEFVLTYLLVAGILYLATKYRDHQFGTVVVGLYVLLYLTAAGLFGGPLSGAVVNPAVVMAPAAYYGIWTPAVHYMAEHILAGIVAGFTGKLAGAEA